MLYLMCMCGEVLGNKQIVYERELEKICSDLNIDFNMYSLGFSDKNSEFIKKRSDLVNRLCRRECCKQQLITYVDVVHLIKGR